VHPSDKPLYELQKIDSRIRSLEREIETLDVGERELARIREMEPRATAAAEALAAVEGALKDAELRLAATEDKHNRHRARLHSGEVKNPKELEALRMEVESLGRTRSHLDEKILTLMDEVETARAAAEEAAAKLAKARKTYEVKGQYAARHQVELESALAEARAAREPAAQAMEPAILKRYEFLAERKAGIGVERVVGNSAEACHTTYPDQVVRTLRKEEGQLFCQECGRFLVFIDD